MTDFSPTEGNREEARVETLSIKEETLIMGVQQIQNTVQLVKWLVIQSKNIENDDKKIQRKAILNASFLLKKSK